MCQSWFILHVYTLYMSMLVCIKSERSRNVGGVICGSINIVVVLQMSTKPDAYGVAVHASLAAVFIESINFSSETAGHILMKPCHNGQLAVGIRIYT